MIEDYDWRKPENSVSQFCYVRTHLLENFVSEYHYVNDLDNIKIQNPSGEQLFSIHKSSGWKNNIWSKKMNQLV